MISNSGYVISQILTIDCGSYLCRYTNRSWVFIFGERGREKAKEESQRAKELCVFVRERDRRERGRIRPHSSFVIYSFTLSLARMFQKKAIYFKNIKKKKKNLKKLKKKENRKGSCKTDPRAL